MFHRKYTSVFNSVLKQVTIWFREKKTHPRMKQCTGLCAVVHVISLTNQTERLFWDPQWGPVSVHVLEVNGCSRPLFVPLCVF